MKILFKNFLPKCTNKMFRGMNKLLLLLSSLLLFLLLLLLLFLGV